MKHLIIGMLLLSVFPAMCQGHKIEVLPSDIQIKTAVLPAPEEKKDGAMVYGYDKSGKLVVLRKGTNNLICIGDNPNKDGINVACYSKKLEPFMARGRELSAKDLAGDEREKIRAKEVASGKLKMPKEPSMMYIYYGKSEDYNTTTGELQNGKFRYVIYTPFATTESTGLPDKPHAPGMPWLMDPGTHRAHIMVGPFD
ncbi:hypothetical protein H4O18_14470 [Arenibacter sp. BSSL-BM3]|uniref:Uncharacterized protein n=1 Tax=Arenibacter arenosicollis TaxID=2762274 RepID=A0ABR7QPR9_9FLAO|nr:hypothetical protein [Arenibacter arenosicollis]MBC8769197.1 hypothetical protein [Arenibacter arenosicollis]